MKRICVIGNSHTACLKLALDKMRDTTKGGKRFTIFGAPGQNFTTLEVRDGRVWSTKQRVQRFFKLTSGGIDSVQLSDFDAFFVVAGQSYFSIYPFTSEQGLMYQTDALIARVLEDRFETNAGLAFARALAGASGERPVFFVGAPFLSERSPVAQRILEERAVAGSAVADTLERIQRALENEFGVGDPVNLVSIRPPEGALEASGLFTRQKFSVGSVKLKDGFEEAHAKGDFAHMNAKYGRLLLDQFEDTLAA